ncbi:hypothetical protein ACEQ8H_007792 [Pleosporales sp. CAS-2024a]
MPPALSDQESSSEAEVPPVKKGGRWSKTVTPVEEPAPDKSGAEDNEPEDEYVVEKILAHKFVKGELVFHVKWQGYDDPKDRTWEPEANMDGAIDVMNEYFDEIGGRPTAKGGEKKRKGRPSGEAKSELGTPTGSVKRVKQEQVWSPPQGSWEHDVDYIDTVEERADPKTGELAKFVYVVWNNDKKTQHPLKHIYQKCPQKMLLYYESHLVFTQNDNLNGEAEMEHVS